jgi:hypothetical protein
MKLRITVLFFLLTISFCSRAQEFRSIKEAFEHKPKFFLNLNSYTSYISGDVASFTGLRFGLSYNKTVRFGLGIAGLNSPIVTGIHIIEDSLSYSTNGNLKYSYVELSAEYIFYNKYPWQFSVPLIFGLGGAHYEYVSRATSSLRHSKDSPVEIVETSANAQYSVFKWIGVGASLGYRATLYTAPEIKENFNSVTFNLGLRLFVDEIYKMVFRKNKTAEQPAPEEKQ